MRYDNSLAVTMQNPALAEAKLIENPWNLQIIKKPSAEQINYCLAEDGRIIRYIKRPTAEQELIAWTSKKRAEVRDYKNPSKNMQEIIVNDSRAIYKIKEINNILQSTRILAINNNPYIIQYMRGVTAEEQELALRVIPENKRKQILEMILECDIAKMCNEVMQFALAEKYLTAKEIKEWNSKFE